MLKTINKSVDKPKESKKKTKKRKNKYNYLSRNKKKKHNKKSFHKRVLTKASNLVKSSGRRVISFGSFVLATNAKISISIVKSALNILDSAGDGILLVNSQIRKTKKITSAFKYVNSLSVIDNIAATSSSIKNIKKGKSKSKTKKIKSEIKNFYKSENYAEKNIDELILKDSENLHTAFENKLTKTKVGKWINKSTSYSKTVDDLVTSFSEMTIETAAIKIPIVGVPLIGAVGAGRKYEENLKINQTLKHKMTKNQMVLNSGISGLVEVWLYSTGAEIASAGTKNIKNIVLNSIAGGATIGSLNVVDAAADTLTINNKYYLDYDQKGNLTEKKFDKNINVMKKFKTIYNIKYGGLNETLKNAAFATVITGSFSAFDILSSSKISKIKKQNSPVTKSDTEVNLTYSLTSKRSYLINKLKKNRKSNKKVKTGAKELKKKQKKKT